MRFSIVAAALAAVLATRAMAQPRLNDPDPYQAQYKEIEEKLRSKRISLDFQDAPLNDVVQFMRQVLGVNILIDQEIFKERGDEVKVTLQVKDLRADNALNLLMSFANLTTRYSNGVMVITTKERYKESVFLAIYDVRDLMFTVRDFPGPRIGIAPSTGSITGATFELAEDDTKNELSDPERLLEIVKSNAGASSWEENDQCSASMINGLLVVNQTRSGHYEVQRLLLMLRAFR